MSGETSSSGPTPGGPTLLALDTATTGCSACIWRGDATGTHKRAGATLAARSTPMARGQAQELMPLVDRVLADAGVEPAQLDAVAVTRGPGAFTGLRIALAAARGFALALGVPCIGVTTLEVLADAVPEAERASGQDASDRDASGRDSGRKVLACVESKRDDIYVQLFSDALHPLTEPLAAGADALAGLFAAGERVVLVGDAAQRALDMLAGADVDAVMSRADALPDPARIAQIAASRLGRDEAAPEPLYLRPPDARLPKNEGRLRG